MANADGSVIIEIDANNRRAVRSLENLRRRAENVVGELNTEGDITFSLNVSQAQRELDRIQQRIYRMIENNRYRESLLPDLEARRNDLTAQYRDAISQDQDDRAQALAREVTAVNRQIQQQREAIESTNRQLDHQRQLYGEITQSIQEASDRTRPEAEQIDMSDARAQLMERFRGISGQVASSLKSAVGAGLSAFKTLTQGIAKALSKMNVFSRAASALGNTFRKLGDTIKNALVFSAVFQGVSMVKQQLGSYMMANAQFTAALGQLKGVLLTAFQPIYDYIIPALVSLMNVLSSVIAVIGKFISVLFGKTAKQSQANAKALYGQAAATEAAGSAAKEAAGSLAAFDEINTIQTENASGGGGGGGGGGAIEPGAPDFDFDYGEEEIKSWGEAFDDFLGTILNDGIPKLRSGLLEFSNWLNEFSRKLYEMFTFPGVKEKVIQIGTDLANAFNDMVNAIDWNLLGHALGAGLNLAILGMVSFLYTFDWINLGMQLAAFINGAVSEIDWYATGMLLWSGFKIAIETLAGFILGLNMPEIAEAASDLIIGFFDSMKETIDDIDWDGIGEQIRDFLENVDWEGIATSVFGAIKSAFTASSDFFSGLLGNELKNTLTDLMIALGEALIVVGAILAFTGANIPLGLGLMAKGAVSLAAAAALDWNKVSGNIKNIISEITLLLGVSFLALGAFFALSGANLPLGIGLLLVGAASLAASAALNWNSIVSLVQGTLGGIIAAGSAALLALGLILCLTGVGIPLGIALIAAGAVGLVSVAAINWNAILDKIKETFNGIVDWWRSNAAKYLSVDYWIQKGKDMILGFIDGIKQKVSGIADAITGAIPKKINVPVMTTSVSSALNVAGAIGKRSAPMPTIEGHSIPALAQGAVIPPNREFLAVLGDQSSGTNIEAPLSTIEKAVENVFSRMGGAGGGDIHITIELDGRVVARNTVKHINDMTRSAGKPVLLI